MAVFAILVMITIVMYCVLRAADEDQSIKELRGLTASEYLRRIRKYYILIKQKQEDLKELRESLAGIRSPLLSDTEAESKVYDASFTERIHKLLEQENEINCLCEQFVNEKNRITGMIQELSDTRNIEILYKRYAEFKSFEDIAREMHYSYSHVRRLHKRALIEFEEKFLKKTER